MAPSRALSSLASFPIPWTLDVPPAQFNGNKQKGLTICPRSFPWGWRSSFPPTPGWPGERSRALSCHHRRGYRKEGFAVSYYLYCPLYSLKHRADIRSSPYVSKIKSDGQLEIQLDGRTLVVAADRVFDLYVNLKSKHWVIIRGF